MSFCFFFSAVQALNDSATQYFKAKKEKPQQQKEGFKSLEQSVHLGPIISSEFFYGVDGGEQSKMFGNVFNTYAVEMEAYLLFTLGLKLGVKTGNFISFFFCVLYFNSLFVFMLLFHMNIYFLFFQKYI